ncbi:restriction endonuclease subunit S [Faecalibacterium prausnitzii]|jgi:type I restriction enzyme S subunit|nr:restriction endonuclease subunit S [Faecalibacterium prausnitzii]MCI3183880.1 restriction endonuclease subunit S [Faecalibacterium prausnitzii]
MKEGYRLLGDFIQPVDERNRDLRVDYLLGVSISKQFIPSIANIVGTDLSNYKIIRTGQFAYGPVTSRNGEKISIALLRDKDCIISSSYTVFEVVNKNELDPEYLMLWFSRPEFDRYARYMSHGSVREIFDWDELCKVELPVPSIDKQRSIVRAYQTITERIELKRRLNDNLEAQTQALFDELFLRDGMPDCTLSEIANVNPTRTLSKGCIAKCYDMSCLPTRGCIPEGGEMKAYNGGVRFQNGDTLIARITPCLENGKAAYINILNDKEVAFGSTEYIVFSPVDTMPSSFYYFLIRSKKFRTFALQYMNGSSGRQRVSGDELAAFPLTKPSHEALSRFDMVAKPVLEQFKVASLEINRLNALQQLIIASISSR